MIGFAKVKKTCPARLRRVNSAEGGVGFLIKLLIIKLFFLSFLFLSWQTVFARPTLEDALGNVGTVAQGAGVGDKISVSEIVSSVIRTGLSIVGILFFILIFYSGFKWMMARGNEEQITKSKNTLFAAVIGLVIVLGAYAITAFVANFL